MRGISDQELEQFRSLGYAVMPGALNAHVLAQLRSICDGLLCEPPDDDHGGQSHDIGRGQDRRFLRHRHRDQPALSALILGAEFGELARRCLEASPWLFNEQFVVKGPHTGASFAWHQDSGYLDQPHAPYLSVWVALDDTNAENGALSVIPRDVRTEPGIEPHRWDEYGKERVGYEGPDTGVRLDAAAGTVVVFSSLTLHRSSANVTPKPRRAYLVQYSPEPIYKLGTNEPKVFAKRL